MFGAVSLTTDFDKHILDVESDLIEIDFFSHPSGRTGRNVIIFGVDMSSSTKIDKRKRGKGSTQGLEYTLSAKKNVFN